MKPYWIRELDKRPMNLGRDGLIEALEGARPLNFPNVFD